MSRTTGTCRAALALALALALGGCGRGDGLRPLRLDEGGRWIGNGVCYGPHRDGQRPGGPAPSAAELRADLALMLPRWHLLRVYASDEPVPTLLKVIRDDRLDMKVMLGVWIAPDAAAANARQVHDAVVLANAYPDIVVAVGVGNETQVSWSDHRCPADSLIACVRRVRAATGVPVTVADDFAFWIRPESAPVAAELDFITMHAHPLWNGCRLDEAPAWLADRVAAVEQAHPDRPVVLGETGWATAALDTGAQGRLIKGRPGEAEQARFFADVTAWAAGRRLPLFFFEAFDEHWKGGADPGEVEKHWGLFRADRTPKAAVR